MQAIYLSSVFDTSKHQYLDVEEILRDIQYGKFKRSIDSLPAYGSVEYKEAKTRLPAWSFSGAFNGNIINKNFTSSNGLFHIDIDGIDDVEAEKERIIDEIPEIVALWLSPSRHGLKGLIRIPDNLINSDDDFKRAFFQVRDYLKAHNIKIDEQCKDVRRLCFVSYDSEIIVNTNAPALILDLSEKKESCKSYAPSNNNNIIINSQETEQKYISRACNIIMSATKGDFHAARIRAGKLGGGYIAANLVDENAMISALIRSSDFVCSSNGDNEQITRRERKAVMDGLDAGRSQPVEGDRNRSYYQAERDSVEPHFPDDYYRFSDTNPEPVIDKIKCDVLDNENKYCDVDLLQYVSDDHIIKRMALELSAVTAIKPSSILLAGLAVHSALLCRAMSVERNGRAIPTNMYAVFEQSTATSKTRILSTFYAPFEKRYIEKSKQIRDEKSLISKEDKEEFARISRIESAFKGFTKTNEITNATPEGIESKLNDSKGYFSCISSEQGIFDSLIGGMYKKDDSKNNNDLVLSAFDGSKMNVLRAGRDGYEGKPIGSIICFAQEGSVDTLLKSSGSSGMGERFLKLIERHRFSESIELRATNKSIMDDYSSACEDLIDGFLIGDSFAEQHQFYMLPMLTISNSDHVKISDYYQSLYSHFDDGKKFSASAMRGFCGKSDIHIIKIAANLHVLDGGYYVNQIASKHIDSAIRIYNALVVSHAHLLANKGVTGDKAAYETVIRVLSGKKLTNTEIKQLIKCVLPFKAHSGDKNEYMNKTIDSMIESGLLVCEIEKKKKVLSVK